MFAWLAGGSVDANKLKWRGAALAHVLKDEKGQAEFLKQLGQEVPEGAVLVGATAGLRAAVARGEVTAEELERFSVRLRRELGPRANFELLSGEHEGLAEWRSVCYELTQRPGPGRPHPEKCAGVLSGGGMSSQLVVRREQVDAFSLDTGLLKSGGLVQRACQGALSGEQLLAGLPAVEAHVTEICAGLPRDLAGDYVLMEYLGGFVCHDGNGCGDITLGLGWERLLPTSELLDALRKHLESLSHEASAVGDASVSMAITKGLVHATLVQGLLRNLFDESARFFGLHEMSWPRGHYLDQSDRHAEAPSSEAVAKLPRIS